MRPRVLRPRGRAHARTRRRRSHAVFHLYRPE